MRKNTPGVECDTCKKWQESSAAKKEHWLHIDARVYGNVGKRAEFLDFCSAKCLAKWGRDVFFAEVVEKVGADVDTGAVVAKARKLRKKKTEKTEEIEGQTTIEEQIAEGEQVAS
jgi:hypothetical protein